MRTGREPFFAVLTPTYKRPRLLARLLDALSRQTLPSDRFSVTVVNDGSHDERYEAAIRPHAGLVRYVPLESNRGPAGASNVAARESKGEVLVFTDDDCVPPADWLERLTASWATAEVDALGGATLPLPSGRASAVEIYLTRSGFLNPGVSDGQIVCLPTSNMAVRREWFERVGGFDERFPYAGGEDLDLTQRLKAAGARLGIARGWATYHPCAFTLAQFCDRFYRYGFGGGLHATYQPGGFRGGVRADGTLLSLALAMPRVAYGSLLKSRGGPRMRLLSLLSNSCYALGAFAAIRKTRAAAPAD